MAGRRSSNSATRFWADESPENVLPGRYARARDGRDLGRDTVEEASVAVLVTGLRAEARRYQVVGGCCLEGTDVPRHRRLGDTEACDQSEELGSVGVVERRPRRLVGREIDS